MTEANQRQKKYLKELYRGREERQQNIREIQDITGRALLVFESAISSLGVMVKSYATPLCDLLQAVPYDSDIDLIIESPGGDINTADKMARMIWKVAKSLRVIIPVYAKSAATILALAADEIVMGLSSELGPIDPHVRHGYGGKAAFESAQNLVEGFNEIANEAIKAGGLSEAYLPLLEGLNPSYLRMCRNSVQAATKLTTEWLEKHMFKSLPSSDRKKKAASIAKKLVDNHYWLDHQSVIDSDDAVGMGLKVIELAKDDPLWSAVWGLHCSYSSFFLRRPTVHAIFESEHDSFLQWSQPST